MKAPENYSLFPGAGKPAERFKHEDYSISIIGFLFSDLIEQHPVNRRNSKIAATEITALIAKRAPGGASLFWKDIISGQLDADRMDYLLRDSLHAGVSYGKFDLDRIVASVCAVRRPVQESEEPKIAIMKGGAYAAEALIVARYWMHKQVYFHKTRLACDHHLGQAVQNIFQEMKSTDEKLGFYPRPDSISELKEFLSWDDHTVMGFLAQGKGGEHGSRLLNRNHYRLVCELAESDSTPQELSDSAEHNRSIIESLGPLVRHVTQPKTLWYKAKANDLILVEDTSKEQAGFLSSYSTLLRNINFGSLQFVYADGPDASQARKMYQQFLRSESEKARSVITEDAESSPPLSKIENENDSAQLKLETSLSPTKPVQREVLTQKGMTSAGGVPGLKCASE